MNKIKKILTGVLTFIFTAIYCLPAVTPVQAATQNELYFSTATENVYASVGEEIIVPVSISNGEGHLIINLNIEFNHSVLELNGITSNQGDNVDVGERLIIGYSPDHASYAIEKKDEFVFVPEGPFDLYIADLSFTAISNATNSPITISETSAISEYEDLEDIETVIGDPIFVTIENQVGISNGTPSGELAKDTTSTTISVETDHKYGYPTCKYALSEGVAYASMPYTFNNREVNETNGNVTHSSVKTGLVNGYGYKYYVKCQDEFGNINTGDYKISFSIKDGKKKEEVKKKKRKIYNSQKKLRQGEILVQRGKRFSKSSTVLLYFSKFGGGYYAPVPIATSSSGTFSVSYRINKPRGTYSWYAFDVKTGKKSKIKTYRVR